MLIKNIFNNKGSDIASNERLDAENIRYITCLKLKYPPKYFFFSFDIKKNFKYSHN